MDGLGGWSRLITSLRYASIFALYSGKGLQNIFLYSIFIVIEKLLNHCFSLYRTDRLALMRNTVLIGEAWTCGHE